MPCGKKKGKGKGGKIGLVVLALLLPFAAQAGGQRTTPISDTGKTVYVEKHRTNRDALAVGALVGAGLTVWYYESRKKDKRVGLVPTSEGAAVKAEWRF